MPRNYFLAVLFLISLAGVCWLFNDFLKSALVAWLLVMVTQGFAIRLANVLAGSKIRLLHSRNEVISAAVLTLGLLLILFLPFIYLTSYAISKFDYQQILGLKSNFIDYLNSVTWISGNIKTKITTTIINFSNEFNDGEHIKRALSMLQGYLSHLGKGLFDLALVVVLFFLFHWYRKDIIAFFAKITPLDRVLQKQLYRNISGTLSIVFLTIFAVAIAQGVAFGLLMVFFDYNPLLLGFFAAISSVVPVFGTALVWVPVVINEVARGNLIGGIIIGCFGSFVLAFLIDNFVRLFFLNRISQVVNVDYKINEFLLFFSIAAGIASFGFWGVLIGPALVALFVALANSMAE